jgi:hypothetical protein
VKRNGSVRQEQPLADLLIAQATGCKHRNSLLLGGEQVAISLLGAISGLTGCAELAAARVTQGPCARDLTCASQRAVVTSRRA